MIRHSVVLWIALAALAGANASLAAQYPSIIDTPGARDLHRITGHLPSVRTAELQVAAAERSVAAMGARRGTLALFAEMEEVDFGNVGVSNVAAGIERQFLPRNQRNAETALASAELAAARARLDAVRLRIGSDIDLAILEWTIHERIVKRLADEDSLLLRAQATLNARFSVGQARYIDVIRLRTERLRVQADALDARSEVTRADLTLRSLVNRDIADFDAGSLKPTILPLPAIAANLDSLINASPVARLADARIMRASAQASVARARKSRVVTAALGAQRFTSEGGGTTFGPTLSASIDLPAGNRRSIELGVEAAQLDSASVTADRSAVLTRVSGNIRAAASSIEAARSRLTAIDQQLVSAAREEREAALNAYANGDLTLAELIDFERSLSRAEIQIIMTYDAAIKTWHDVQQVLSGEIES